MKVFTHRDSTVDSHSPSDTSVDTSRMENSPDIIVVESNEGEDNAGGTNAAIDGTEGSECVHCGEKIKKLKEGTTTPLLRHVSDFLILNGGKGQSKLKVSHGKTDSSTTIQNWKFDNTRMRELHKCILSFVDVPPPYSGVGIYDCLYKCLKDWNIESKVASLTVDNAKTNDVVARKLLENLNLQKKVVVGGKLFHVRCCAHILNLLVQDGLSEIIDITHNVRESVKHVNALEFKDVFKDYTDRECSYTTLPSDDDWKKVEDICLFLALFNESFHHVSSEYPTSNLFLLELYGIKESLDELVLDGNAYMKPMAVKMKRKFDKYWGPCNLLISMAAVLDPRYKTKLLNFSFKAIYSNDEASTHVKLVIDTLKELFVDVESELDTYQEEGAADILAIPVTTVASESAFSASGRIMFV
uniref:hAT-like transposase RNase-H fold domain-containing protein n=1 Tax=Lactuca sativa TaxID=4236 RepID=A0A9R1VMB3_LACSA|nr:hypothetical protein LSAT_V11C500292120 [Lactuca sativa]